MRPTTRVGRRDFAADSNQPHGLSLLLCSHPTCTPVECGKDPVSEIRSIPGLKRSYASRPTEIQEYFEHLCPLVDSYPLEVGLAYAFSRLETAQNVALYCGLVKVHRANAKIARAAIDAYFKTTADFEDKYLNVFGHKMPSRARTALSHAQNVRNQVLHGKVASAKDKRNAIARVLDFAVSVNAHVNGLAGFMPFDDLRGFKGRAASLDESTTKWILRGMGFPVR
ncbi:MAG: hypothetical protein DHS20C21_00690 [Gemmatimonadota bacterium]|nr:MAG: hypothetical protein DHS20C21_00690 [Gemmatimonadota bacterium]